MGNNKYRIIMRHDISKLHPIHQQMYKDFVASEYTPDKVSDELYNTYLALSKIPQKDWGKPSTQEAIQKAVDDIE